MTNVPIANRQTNVANMSTAVALESFDLSAAKCAQSLPSHRTSNHTL